MVPKEFLKDSVVHKSNENMIFAAHAHDISLAPPAATPLSPFGRPIQPKNANDINTIMRDGQRHACRLRCPRRLFVDFIAEGVRLLEAYFGRRGTTLNEEKQHRNNK